MLLRVLIAGSLLLGVSVAGCQSGQTGSPGVTRPMWSCVCDGGIALRVHVDLHEGDLLEATVIEAYSALGSGFVTVGAGEKVGGTIQWAKPCESVPTPPEFAGAELLVSYRNVEANAWTVPSCQQRDTCMAECALGTDPEGVWSCNAACRDSTAMTCRQELLLDGSFGWAIPYADPLDLGKPIPLSRVSQFPSECLSLFPDKEFPPRELGSCGLSTAPPRPAAFSLLVWGGSLLWALTRLGRFCARRGE